MIRIAIVFRHLTATIWNAMIMFSDDCSVLYPYVCVHNIYIYINTIPVG